MSAKARRLKDGACQKKVQPSATTRQGLGANQIDAVPGEISNSLVQIAQDQTNQDIGKYKMFVGAVAEDSPRDDQLHNDVIVRFIPRSKKNEGKYK